MLFKENKDFLSKENKDFIENIIFNKKMFPWYILQETVRNIKINPPDIFLGHTILSRLESEHMKDVVNSHFYDPTVDILNNFLNSIKVKKNFFTRISYNLTFNNGVEKCPIHTDHEFSHNQIIIYLNDCLDKKSNTVILNEKEEIIKEIKPEKYKGICFGSNKHYHFFPTKGMRVVLVATFI
jgi:hypothetical protein